MYNYQFSQHPTYRASNIILKTGEVKKILLEFPAIAFIPEGRISVFSPETEIEKHIEGQIFILPQDLLCHIQCEKKCRVTIIEIPDLIALVIHFFPNISFDKKFELDTIFHSIPMNKTLTSFYNVLNCYMDESTIDNELLRIKIMELFYVLNSYYTTDLLKITFTPVMSEGYTFVQFVLSNYKKIKV